jgi:hypothetical protein
VTTTITTQQVKTLASKDLAHKWFHPNTGELRWYLQVAPLIGLETARYKTGNIAYAQLNGEKISNSEATRIGCMKAWVDGNGVLYMQSAVRARTDVAALLKAGIAEATAEATA